ncbi:UDP-Glycosyltransferase superfamily protein [Striga asiatica]|uniref:Glycosyltransferase n=1 Tax=Striga asiatica TaxID=4170 RepID=A0A5A7RD71_STRAF|nr:UDP-Glycosyltransferase superfamily protein [Striga asiatica]
MAIQHKHHHFVLFPFLAQGHLIPMVDISRLLAKRGLTVTILTTPRNHSRVEPVIQRAADSGLDIRVSHIELPSSEAGLPSNCDNFEMLSSVDDILKFFRATAKLEDQVEHSLRNLKPDPTCLLSDSCYPWTTGLAARLRISRLVFHGMSCFSLLCMHMLDDPTVFKGVSSDTEYSVLPGLPDRVELTKAQLRGTAEEVSPEWEELRREVLEADSKGFGIVFNTFEELEAEYVKGYAEAKGTKVWCVGPVSSCNDSDFLDKAQRGNRPSIDEHECLRWLGSREQGTVVYVCLGSLSRLAAPQLVELGLGLEGSARPFVWVVRNAPDEFEKWLGDERFEERVEGRGFLIRGWAPQVLILENPSVGGFVTHCGWNSTLEGVVAGVPMLTWPVFAEQFSNEKFVLSVAKTGVRVGVEVPVVFGEEEKVGVQVRSEGIKAGIEELMDGGERGAERRERARELGKMAKRATEEGGSSYVNVTRLIEDVVGRKIECGGEFGSDEKRV